MKLIYLANLRMPTEKAEGVQTVKTCEALKNLGVDIELWVPKRLNGLKSDPFSYYDIKNTFPIIKIPTLDLVKFGRLGFLIHSFVFALFAKQRLSKIDCLNIYGRDENVLSLFLKSRKNIFWESHRGNLSSRARSVAAKAKKIIVITEGLKSFYTQNGISSDKLVVIPDGVDLATFDVEVNKDLLRKQFGIKIASKVVAYIGLLDEWKGYKTFLEASKRITDAQFVVIGGEERTLESLRKEYPKVLFLGFLPYKDLPKNQQIADVLVIPNSGKFAISKFYTSPLKLFAHMASGVPIVASDLPSIREVLDEKSAILVKPDDSDALVEGIKTALNKSDVAKALAETAKSLSKKYSWEERAKRILEIIS